MSQKASGFFQTKHKEFIHSVAFNFHGDRLATCGSDQTIKVWDNDSKDGWVLSKEFAAHSAPIWQVKWADPVFGNVLGSCSFDRTVMVWEERNKDTKSRSVCVSTAKYWKQMAHIREFKDSVTDIDFAPREMGLVLGACSEGKVKVIEVHLHQQNNYRIQGGQIQISARCKLTAIAWNPAQEPLFAVSCEHQQEGQEVGDSILLEVIMRKKDKWKPGAVIKKQPHVGSVTSVAWAHSLGRSFHLLATGDEHGVVALWRGVVQERETEMARIKLEPFCKVEVFSDMLQKQRVWKVGFNLMSSVLLATGQNSVTKIYKLSKLAFDPYDWTLSLLGECSLAPSS